jgi:hypothetical protein
MVISEEERVAGGDIGQKAEGGDGLQAALHVVGVAVDVFEAVGFTVRGGHELDHADVGVGGHARGLVELGPAEEVGLDL